MIINDEELEAEIIEDLINTYSYSKSEAAEFASDNGASIVSDMWDAYSNYIQDFCTDKGE